MAVERREKERREKERREKERREKVNDYSGTIVSERRRWRTHTLGPKSLLIWWNFATIKVNLYRGEGGPEFVLLMFL
jgi:hypothetical protein